MASNQAVAAGFVLFLIGTFAVPNYFIYILVLYKGSPSITGFRFLLSEAIANSLLICQFGLWPGVIIMFQDPFLPESLNPYVSFWCDFVFFSMAHHYPLVAWSRFAVAKNPAWFRSLGNKICVALCVVPWFLGFMLCTAVHSANWYSKFYYEPAQYGAIPTDWSQYESEGTKSFWTAYHITIQVVSIFFYIATAGAIEYNKRQQEQQIQPTGVNYWSSRLSYAPTSSAAANRIIEKRLLWPCGINAGFYIVSVLLLNILAAKGKWGVWSYSFGFLINIFINPILIQVCSKEVREKTKEIIL